MDNVPLQNVYMIGNFKIYCTRGQLNSEGGEELHEIKWSRDKTEIGKEIM